jgi:hypothetical protein
VASLLEKSNRGEARKWLTMKKGHKTTRSLGSFRRKEDAAKLVASLYRAGATKVIVPDIYSNKAGGQFADCLFVRLPRDRAKRKAIREVCRQLRRRRRSAVQPDEDIGEIHLYLYLG